MTYFACCECWENPRQSCMFENHSTAFPDAMMKDLGCPMGLKPNWRFLDGPDLRKIKPKMTVIGSIRKCYSQRDLEKGLTIVQFYEQQGRVYEHGDWIFPKNAEYPSNNGKEVIHEPPERERCSHCGALLAIEPCELPEFVDKQNLKYKNIQAFRHFCNNPQCPKSDIMTKSGAEITNKEGS